MPLPECGGTQRAILVVEDHDAVRRFVTQSLQHAGYTTFDAANAADALNLVRAHADSIALAIVDMVMPDMNGLDLAVEIERVRSGISILFTSGHVSSIAIQGMSESSPQHVLTKPFSERELLAHVTALL